MFQWGNWVSSNYNNGFSQGPVDSEALWALLCFWGISSTKETREKSKRYLGLKISRWLISSSFSSRGLMAFMSARRNGILNQASSIYGLFSCFICWRNANHIRHMMWLQRILDTSQLDFIWCNNGMVAACMWDRHSSWGLCLAPLMTCLSRNGLLGIWPFKGTELLCVGVTLLQSVAIFHFHDYWTMSSLLASSSLFTLKLASWLRNVIASLNFPDP